MTTSVNARLRQPAWEPSLFPLDEPAAALIVGRLRLDALQAREAGGAVDVPVNQVLPAGTQVAWAADAVFSRATLAALKDAAAAHGGIVQAAVKRGTPLWRSATRLLDVEGIADNGSLRLPLWAGPMGGRLAVVSGDAVDAFPDAVALSVCDEDSAVCVRVPPYGRPPHVVEIPSVSKLGGRLLHWLHLLELSLAALASERRALGLTGGRNRFYGNVDIHPTATVIGSILEDGVKVEPHASVIDSWLGRGVLVADHSVVHTSVIADRCRSLVDTSLRRVVAMGMRDKDPLERSPVQNRQQSLDMQSIRRSWIDDGDAFRTQQITVSPWTCHQAGVASQHTSHLYAATAYGLSLTHFQI